MFVSLRLPKGTRSHRLTFPKNAGFVASDIYITSTFEIDCDAIRRDMDRLNQDRDPSLAFSCNSGPKGSKPSFIDTAPQSTETSEGGNTTETDNHGESDELDASIGSRKKTDAIVGGVTAGVVALVLIGVVFWQFRNRLIIPKPPSHPRAEETKLGGIEEEVGGIQDSGREVGGIAGVYK